VTTLLDLRLDLAGDAAATGIRVAAVVLAAGSSRRMGGRAKLLLDVRGEPMIRRTVANVLAAAPVETVVVTGDRAGGIAAALAGLPVRLVHNPRHAEGQPTSVAAGVRALSVACDAVMVALGDQPQVTPADLRALVAAYERLAEPSILVPHFGGRRGNPVIFAVRHVPEVLSGSVRVGCRHLIEAHPDAVAAVEMASDAYTVDCDTPEDYAALLRRLGGTGA
jgi:molybdenum cofactor cytidylyltransferase